MSTLTRIKVSQNERGAWLVTSGHKLIASFLSQAKAIGFAQKAQILFSEGG